MKQFHISLLIVLLSLLIAGCNTKTKNADVTKVQEQLQLSARKCMENIIALDDSLGTVRNNLCKNVSLSETITQYTEALGKFDYAYCPEAFTTAFKKHREAWLDMLTVTDKYPDLRGEMHDVFAKIEVGEDAEAFAPLLKSVRDTWTEVENAMKD